MINVNKECSLLVLMTTPIPVRDVISMLTFGFSPLPTDEFIDWLTEIQSMMRKNFCNALDTHATCVAHVSKYVQIIDHVNTTIIELIVPTLLTDQDHESDAFRDQVKNMHWTQTIFWSVAIMGTDVTTKDALMKEWYDALGDEEKNLYTRVLRGEVQNPVMEFRCNAKTPEWVRTLCTQAQQNPQLPTGSEDDESSDDEDMELASQLATAMLMMAINRTIGASSSSAQNSSNAPMQ